jgi:hypothetical protein
MQCILISHKKNVLNVKSEYMKIFVFKDIVIIKFQKMSIKMHIGSNINNTLFELFDFKCAISH